MLQTLVLQILPSHLLRIFSWKNDIELVLIPAFILLCRVKSTCGVFLFSFTDLFGLDLFVRAELLCTQ